VAENRPRAAGQDCGGGALDRLCGRPPDGVDAAIDAVETAELDLTVDPGARDAQVEKLLAGDIAVVP
jgi:hypothetical protein